MTYIPFISATGALVLSATSAHAIDNCMVGMWDADGADIATVMAEQMIGSTRYLGGSVTLEIDPSGAMTLLANDLMIEVNVPGTPSFTVIIAGRSQGTMTANDGRNYVAVAPEYDLIGSAEVLGSWMETPVTSAGGSGWGQSTGTYGCQSNSMSFEASPLGSIPRSWQRTQ